MKKKVLSGMWIFMYVMCSILGLIEPENGFQKWAMTITSVLFFLPPAALLVDAFKDQDTTTMFRVRLLSIISLCGTLLGLIVNIAVVGASENVGTAMYIVLNFLSVPMLCSRHYVLSMFLWACLLFVSIPKFWGKRED